MELYQAQTGAVFAYRTVTGSNPTNLAGPAVGAPYWVKLVRVGNALTGSISPDGVKWTQVATTTINIATNLYIGLAVTSRDASPPITPPFHNVRTAHGP